MRQRRSACESWGRSGTDRAGGKANLRGRLGTKELECELQGARDGWRGTEGEGELHGERRRPPALEGRIAPRWRLLAGV